jgi:hypothetical protein
MKCSEWSHINLCCPCVVLRMILLKMKAIEIEMKTLGLGTSVELV